MFNNPIKIHIILKNIIQNRNCLAKTIYLMKKMETIINLILKTFFKVINLNTKYLIIKVKLPTKVIIILFKINNHLKGLNKIIEAQLAMKKCSFKIE